MSFDMEKAVAGYLMLRDKIDATKKRHKEELAVLTEKQEKLAALMEKGMELVGEDATIKTKVGTVFKAKKDSVRIANKSEFTQFIMDQINELGVDGLGMLTLSANKNAIKEYMEENNDDLPAGIKYEQWLELQVRRA